MASAEQVFVAVVGEWHLLCLCLGVFRFFFFLVDVGVELS